MKIMCKIFSKANQLRQFLGTMKLYQTWDVIMSQLPCQFGVEVTKCKFFTNFPFLTHKIIEKLKKD